jgi:adenylate cyclase
MAQRALALDPDEPTLLYNMACIHSLTGNSDDAVSSLERALDAGLSVGEWLEQDSQLDSIRGHPRYPAILERVRSK